MRILMLGERLAICRLPAGAAAPEWLRGGFHSVTRTAGELSVVCEEGPVPPDVPCERGWRALQVEGPLDFALVGVLASLAVSLAEAGVSIFAVSTFDTDYVLVKEERLAAAADALQRAGHEVIHANLTDRRPMSLTREKAQLMSASEIDRTLVRLAHEILEKTKDLDLLAFIGIRRRGVPLAQRLAAKISSLENRTIPVGILDINLYRDDLSTVDVKPVVSATEISFSVQGKDIILVDDVLYTGRTIRAALDALFDHGRPSRVQLLVLIDRGHRELPIEARFVGRKVQTTDSEIIEVKFQEIDAMEKVLLVEKTAAVEA
ncbi:MAG: bifunctional pyr operon transcriptional regulator/uracil phosphoribosyltransferase PyrR [Candidatus Sulfopaludibacter sp.]|nr:bifunctional pyr operon transcriptional regulator/uracil phosphoribosyltransferase PyrR [Candidatus Sulfopaludibacter sp.]